MGWTKNVKWFVSNNPTTCPKEIIKTSHILTHLYQVWNLMSSSASKQYIRSQAWLESLILIYTYPEPTHHWCMNLSCEWRRREGRLRTIWWDVHLGRQNIFLSWEKTSTIISSCFSPSLSSPLSWLGLVLRHHRFFPTPPHPQPFPRLAHVSGTRCQSLGRTLDAFSNSHFLRVQGKVRKDICEMSLFDKPRATGHSIVRCCVARRC